MLSQPDEKGVGAIQVQGGFAGDPIPDDPAIAAGIPGEYTTDAVDVFDPYAADPDIPDDEPGISGPDI